MNVDISDFLNNGKTGIKNDLVLDSTDKFKTRNLLKTSPQENVYYPDSAFDFMIFLRNNISPNTLLLNITQYLFRYLVQPENISFTYTAKGQGYLTITTKEEIYNVALQQ